MSYVYVIFAKGFEEIEGLTVVDLLRRADIEVRMTGLDGAGDVTGAHGIRVGMDCSLDDLDLEEADAIVLPGGMPGTGYLEESQELAAKLKDADRRGIRLGAICAAPRVLGGLGLLEGRSAVCYPGTEEYLKGASVSEVPVVTDGIVTTSRGMGTAIDFALELIREIKSREEADRIRKAIIYER